MYEIGEGRLREGPGSDEVTRRALSLTKDVPAHPRILDVGCGRGAQTIALARATDGEIVAVDLRERFLKELIRRAKKASVAARIHAVQASMFELGFRDESFDLVWSEGAIYIIGFARGLKEWKRMLKPGGWIAVSELAWLVDDPPEKPRQFWGRDYPAMRNRDANLAAIRECGYTDVQSFVLGYSAWWDDFYGPSVPRIAELRGKYADDREALAFLDAAQAEVDLFREYHESYSYLFYVMRKPAASSRFCGPASGRDGRSVPRLSARSFIITNSTGTRMST